MGDGLFDFNNIMLPKQIHKVTIPEALTMILKELEGEAVRPSQMVLAFVYARDEVEGGDFLTLHAVDAGPPDILEIAEWIQESFHDGDFEVGTPSGLKSPATPHEDT